MAEGTALRHSSKIVSFQTITESKDLECKLAAGSDGKGRLPKDFWATYSAFANTHGGVVVLGVREISGRFEIHGVVDEERIISDLFNTLNNTQKVSVNLLTESHVQRRTIDGKVVIEIWVPAASRKQKPVYLNGNPFKGNTYRRLHSGDRRCDDETVKRMLAEQVEDSRDTRILGRYSLADTDSNSLHAYRNMLAAHKPDHPWIELDDLEFLRALGGWRQDRSSSEEGLTQAGLLMFGTWPALQEALPLYFLDYQERPGPESDTRWLDRVVPDGTWSGNLFDFFRRVARKLVADLKVPFALEGGLRQDDTPRHRALREALVNALVHSDYSDRASVLVIKQPNGFVFRNPGGMRVPAEIALKGGESDCRNRTLHQMFLMIGLGERAGSGLPKIRQGWEADGGRLELFDSFEPYDQTRLSLLWGPPQVSGKTSGKMTGKVTGKVTGKMTGKVTGKTSARILEMLAETPSLTLPEMAKILKKSESTVERAIRALRKSGQLRRVGSTRGGHWEVNNFD